MSTGGRRLMRATARIVAVPDGRGGTGLPTLAGEPPLLVRRTGARQPGVPANVHLVGGAAGPLGGDRLRIEITVESGASLVIRTVAASIALPTPDAHGRPDTSLVEVHATVAPGGTLHWLPEPLIAAAGCDHDAVTTVEVADGGTLVWRDELVCGRHREPSGDVRLHTTIRYAGRTLYRHDLSAGPAAPGWSGPAVLGTSAASGAIGGGRATGSLIVIDPAWAAGGPPPAAPVGDTAAVMPLPGPAILATAVGGDLRAVRGPLDACLHLTPALG
ncbi:urease accessory protein [Catenuloplanes nepalensis]|uniref:Urease accessory protein UreD n=1 Tax=Catenuloplanes nepalensis TaxID=587533 RepID=A0ABT9MYE0_9ACTN|nr:urease accessory protein UreD [Catenuloplanes nepalensis]MDP9796261.1 urease accessory protein [Catenuloplanes nepalensis]